MAVVLPAGLSIGFARCACRVRVKFGMKFRKFVKDKCAYTHRKRTQLYAHTQVKNASLLSGFGLCVDSRDWGIKYVEPGTVADRLGTGAYSRISFKFSSRTLSLSVLSLFLPSALCLALLPLLLSLSCPLVLSPHCRLARWLSRSLFLSLSLSLPLAHSLPPSLCSTSLLHQTGMIAGSVIVKFNGEPVARRSISAFLREMGSADELSLAGISAWN